MPLDRTASWCLPNIDGYLIPRILHTELKLKCIFVIKFIAEETERLEHILVKVVLE